MRIDQSQVSMLSSYNYLASQHFNGSYQADTAGSSSQNASHSSKVQISDQGRQAAASDGTQSTDLSGDISSPMDLFRSTMENMLGVSIQSMQFSGNIAEGQSGGTWMQATQNRLGTTAAMGQYNSSNFDLQAQGTLVTADGRTLSFSAELSMQETDQQAIGVSNMPGNPLASLGQFAQPSQASNTPVHNVDGKSLHDLLAAPADASKAQSKHHTHHSGQTSGNSGTDNSADNTDNSGSSTDSSSNTLSASADPIVLQLNDPVYKQLSVWLKDHNVADNLTAMAKASTAAANTATQADADSAKDAQNDDTPSKQLQSAYLKLAGAFGQASNLNVSI